MRLEKCCGTMALIILWFVGTSVFAKQISYGSSEKPRQSVAVTFAPIDFRSDATRLVCPDFGTCATERTVFSNPAIGLVYERPGLRLTAQRGTWTAPDANNSNRTLTDLSLLASGTLYGFPTSEEIVQVSVPIAIHSGYRKLTGKNSTRSDGNSDFSSVATGELEITTVSIGLGLAVKKEAGALTMEARVLPFFGLASQSVSFGTGSTTALDAEFSLATGPVIGKLGLVLGYQFRWQRWNLDAASGINAESLSDRYTGRQHVFRLGATF